MKKTIIMTTLLLFAVAVAATSLEEATAGFNDNIGSFPDAVKSLIGDETIHVMMKNLDGSTQEFAAVTEDGLIVNATAWVDEDDDGNSDNWDKKTTMFVYMDESAINNIVTSESPVDAFNDEWGEGIRVEGVGFKAKVKAFFAKIGLIIAGWFS